jgi:predicted GNAT family acetyltransferase
VLRTSTLKVLGPQDLAAATALVDRDPAAHVFVASRLHASGMEPWRLGGELWGWFEGDELVSMFYAGANLVPVEASPVAIEAFAEHARRGGRRCSSIVGPAEEVDLLWKHLEQSWGPARSVRPCQPLMVADGPLRVLPDPAVMRVTAAQLDVLLPACVAMFTEEVGVSPLASDGGRLYRARVAELIRSGRAFARIEDGEVVFKAEIGAVSAHACQLQGVWVAPHLRGSGLSAPGLAAVVDVAAREIAPLVSLYVNDYNVAARASYRRIGMREVGALASVLF